MIKQDLASVQARIASACAKAGRAPEEITVVAVSKGKTVSQIKEVIAGGITDIGENRVQEALIKHNELITHNSELRAIKWHMVGHLQTNKVQDAVQLFDLIHSVDSLRLAEQINKESEKIHKSQDGLLEVNISGEPSKFGIKPEETIGVIKEIAKFKNLNIKGLMGIAPIVDEPEKTRPYFRILRDLLAKIYPVQNYSATGKEKEVLNGAGEPLILSMGMSDDFEIAIEEGSNMLRLGRIVFEGLN